MLQILSILIVILIAVSVSPAYAQHHSGSLAPPIDFGGMTVALSSILSPEDFTVEDTKTANLSIRFYDSETNVNINSVTYRVQIFQGEQLVASEYFYDDDGRLDLEIRPTVGCLEQQLWKCTKYFGEKHAIAGAYYARGDSRPVIQGPVFDQSGQYNVKVSIVGATNPKTMTTSDLHFETFLSIPQKQMFFVQSASAEEFPVSIKSFDSEVSAFNFDEKSNKISYDTFFEWNADEHDASGVRQSVHLQKDFSAFKQGYDVDISVNGIQLKDSSFLFDVTSPDENILRLDIPHDEMMEILNVPDTEPSDPDVVKIEILPGEQTNLSQLDFTFENDYTSKVIWDSDAKTGEKIPFTFLFLDANDLPAHNILYAYSVTDLSGKEIWSNIGTSDTYLGILSLHGISQESVLIPTDGKYNLTLILTGQENKNFERFFVSEADFEISKPVMDESSPSLVPSWIKNNAGWWADDEISDDSFIQGIQFLIEQKIIQIPDASSLPQENSGEIPSWIKNNAGWWAEGSISESDFVQGLEFLISHGIIAIN